MRDTVISVCAAALVVVAELLSEDAWNEQKLVDLWALVMEYDQSLWYGLLGHAADVDVLIEGLNVNSLKDTVVATLSKIARGDVELGKLSPAVLLNFKEGYFLKKSACAFFDKIQENNGPRRKQLMHLIAMAVR